MTVFEVVVVVSQGGTSGEFSIALHRSSGRDLRRRHARRERGPGPACDVDGPPRSGSFGELEGSSRGRVGGARPGRKICSLVATILAGGTHIDHADMLRAGATQRVLPFRVMAPSTLGTFLRAFTFGHVRQLDAVIGEALRRAWRAGAGAKGTGGLISVRSNNTLHGVGE